MGPLLFVTFMLSAAPPPEASPSYGPPIIVTGKKLADTESALRDCIARKCPPDEDIDATLAHSENLFAAGDYREARTVLRRSLSRNEKQARSYPVPVSDLHRANAMVSDHLGFDRDYERSTWGILDALKKGIPTPDARHLGARMEIAAMRARLHGLEEAGEYYDDLARDADRAGRPDIAGMARLRSAGISYRLRPTDSARNRIRAIAQLTGPENLVAASMAKLYLARIAREAGRVEEAEALVREVGGGNFANPVLIYSPPYVLNVQAIPKAANVDLSSATLRMMGNPAASFGGNFDKLWVDVGFWVQADGKVSDLEVVRKQGDSSWADPLLKSIAGRLYAPAQAPAYRLERYSYTSEWQDQTGSHIKRRSPKARIEYLDLTHGGRIEPQ
jgi:hypothetical protein